MNDLMSNVLEHLGPAQIDAIAQKLGVSPEQASNAIEQALPLLTGGLAHSASDPQGVDALHNALSNDHSGIDIGGLLGGLLGGGASADGGGILGHIFGPKQTQAAQGLGQSSGIGTQNAGQLMGMLAPILMGVLGNMTKSQGLDSGGLGGLLGQQAQHVQNSTAGGLLSAVLDHNGDGHIDLSEIMQAGQSVLGAFTRRS
ncbi:MAG: DUF937 domain-containing protein [Dokdonella sp.]